MMTWKPDVKQIGTFRHWKETGNRTPANQGYC